MFLANLLRRRHCHCSENIGLQHWPLLRCFTCKLFTIIIDKLLYMSPKTRTAIEPGGVHISSIADIRKAIIDCSCVKQSLFFVQITDEGSGRELASLSGTHDNATIYSDTNNVTLLFTSDKHGRDTGFRLEYAQLVNECKYDENI